MKIFIDPGHGGNDPGAIGIKGTKEAAVVLKIAKKLKEILLKEGFETVMSRESDVAVSLNKRAEMANQAYADLFLSIHCNGFANSAAKGTEVYSCPGDDMGKTLASKMSEGVSSALGTNNRGAKEEKFAVLRLSKMTAVLIETAFITNVAEEEMMQKEEFYDKVALAIANSIFSTLGIPEKPCETSQHWGFKHLESLQSKGFIKNPEIWGNMETAPTTAMVLALVDKITEVI